MFDNVLPLTLTPLEIKTSGVLTADPVTATFSDGAGYSVTTPAISVTSGGTLTVPVPLYVAPATHNVASGQVSIVLTQDGQSSAPVSFTIQELPPLSDYGTQLGQISHAFLIYEQLLLARRLDELQVAQLGLNGSVDLGAAVSTLYYHLMPSANFARQDVDMVIANNGSVMQWGTLSDGTPLQFDATQLDLMDRLAAVYLLQQFGGSVTVARYAAQSLSYGNGAHAPAAGSSASKIQTMLGLITGHDTIDQLIDDVHSAPDSAASTGLAFLDGLKAFGESAGAEKFVGYVGMVSGLAHFGQAVNSELNFLLPTATCLATSCTQDEANSLSSGIEEAGRKVATADASAISSVSKISDLLSNIASYTSESLQATVTVYEAATDGSLQGLWDATSSAATSAGYQTMLSKLGVVSGDVTISNILGSAASLPAVELQQCSTCANIFSVIGMADPGGSYDLVIPLNVGGNNYADMEIVAFDIATGTSLSSEAVDLTGLNTSQPVQVPPMSGTCNDPDYGSPDGDDPDCD